MPQRLPPSPELLLLLLLLLSGPRWMRKNGAIVLMPITFIQALAPPRRSPSPSRLCVPGTSMSASQSVSQSDLSPELPVPVGTGDRQPVILNGTELLHSFPDSIPSFIVMAGDPSP